MSRHISVHIVTPDAKGAPEIRTISGYVAQLCGMRTARDGSLVIGGCGMDMGFHVVYTLGSYLWPAGPDKPRGTRNGEPDSDGGYALKHRWL
jgi:hypothetical protein